MEEFAAVSGISRPTLSKYFNDPQSVRKTTRARIEEALEHNDYRPNLYAVNQNRRMTRNIGVVVPFLTDPVFAEMARLIEMNCTEAGYRALLLGSQGRPELEQEHLSVLGSLRPAGVLFAPLGGNSNQEAIAQFCEDVPTVFFNSDVEGHGLGFVGSDNAELVENAVSQVMKSGPAPCFFDMKHPSGANALDRRVAYSKIMQRRGLEPQFVSIAGTGWDMEEIGRLGAHACLEEGGFPSRSILCCNDRLAIGLLSACFEKGQAVGTDAANSLKVVSIGNNPFSKFTCPALTTAAHDMEAMTKEATRKVFEMAEAGGRGQEKSITYIPSSLVARRSG